MERQVCMVFIYFKKLTHIMCQVSLAVKYILDAINIKWLFELSEHMHSLTIRKKCFTNIHQGVGEGEGGMCSSLVYHRTYYIITYSSLHTW